MGRDELDRSRGPENALHACLASNALRHTAAACAAKAWPTAGGAWGCGFAAAGCQQGDRGAQGDEWEKNSPACGIAAPRASAHGDGYSCVRPVGATEAGSRSPSFETWDRICKHYCWPADICGGRGPNCPMTGKVARERKTRFLPDRRARPSSRPVARYPHESRRGRGCAGPRSGSPSTGGQIDDPACGTSCRGRGHGYYFGMFDRLPEFP